jgi:hypothetical protein
MTRYICFIIASLTVNGEFKKKKIVGKVESLWHLKGNLQTLLYQIGKIIGII